MKLGNMLCKVVLFAFAMTIGSQAWGVRMPDASYLEHYAREFGVGLGRLSAISDMVKQTKADSDGTFCRHTSSGKVDISYVYCRFGYEPASFSDYIGFDVDRACDLLKRFSRRCLMDEAGGDFARYLDCSLASKDAFFRSKSSTDTEILLAIYEAGEKNPDESVAVENVSMGSFVSTNKHLMPQDLGANLFYRTLVRLEQEGEI